MKILFLGDASSYHATLARELSKRGHDVTVASNGSRWMDTRRDIDLSRRPGKLGGGLLWLKLSTVLSSRLKGYDVVQLVNPTFVDLKPERIKTLFERLKRTNGKITLTALGTDTYFIRGCLDPESPLEYSEWVIDGRKTEFADSERGRHLSQWLDNPLAEHCRYIYDNIDGVATALYEYHKVLEPIVDPTRLHYAGIPIDTKQIQFCPPTGEKPVKILAPYHSGREGEKGTEILYEMARKLPDVVIDRVTGLRYAEFVERMKEADVVLDQLYSYTPATTALMAMAMGKTVVTGGEHDFARWIGEDTVPVVNPDPRNPERLTEDLRVVIRPDEFVRTGIAARKFVEKHNDVAVVADRFETFWINLYSS